MEAAQNTLKRVADGQLSRPQNRSRAERILNTLFLYHLAGVAGLTLDQILDAVCDIKPNDETLEAQRGHYETLLGEMCSKLRNQVRKREGRYEFIPKESGIYEDLVYQAAERLKTDPTLFRNYVDRLIGYRDPSDQSVNSPFAEFVRDEDWQRVELPVKSWHGQERSGRVTIADLGRSPLVNVEVEGEDDFLIVLSRRPLTEKEVGKLLSKEGKPIDPRVVVWAPAAFDEAEKTTLASIAAHLMVADENRGGPLQKEALREFRKEAHRAFNAIQKAYSRGIVKTSRTSVDPSGPGGVPGILEEAAKVAMDSCYESRNIDFASRRFDTQAAVKLINGLVKRSEAVSEGDQLWSAVENFAPPLGLVRPETPKRLDPGTSRFYQMIEKKVLQFGRTGLEVRTVYNWFTGYHPEDGKESPGLTRRMVDVYLLAMVRAGKIRISQKKGSFLDRNTIALIDFKPETLRGLERIDLPRPLDNWDKFYSYLEVLLSRREGTLGPVPEGSLGPLYDRGKADEALRSLWADHWINTEEVNNLADDLRGLYRDLGKTNSFDELLLYWLGFAEEPKPTVFDDEDVYDAFRRAVIRVAQKEDADELDEAALKQFRERFKDYSELRVSFVKSRSKVVRAARLARTSVSSHPELEERQQELLAELENVDELILNPDRISVRLLPRIEKFEEAYVPVYVRAVLKLVEAQNELNAAGEEVESSEEVAVLSDFAEELDEARDLLSGLKTILTRAPGTLLSAPVARKSGLDELVRHEVLLPDDNKIPLQLPRLETAIDERRRSTAEIRQVGPGQLKELIRFLLSPGVLAVVNSIPEILPGLDDIRCAESLDAVAEALLALPSRDRKCLAKRLKAALGHKEPKVVQLRQFRPRNGTVLEHSDIDRLVTEFREFLESVWEEGKYLRLEK